MMILLSCKRYSISSVKFTNRCIIWVQENEEYFFCVTQFAADPFRSRPFIEFEATEGLEWGVCIVCASL